MGNLNRIIGLSNYENGYIASRINIAELNRRPKITNGHWEHKPYQNDFGKVNKEEEVNDSERIPVISS